MSFNLSEKQLSTLNEVLEYYHACSGKGYALLTGKAGTGKTTVTKELVSRLRKDEISVALTATTHEAVSVIRAVFNYSVIADTVHRYLKLRLVKTEKGEEVLVPSNAQPNIIDVLIVDEASMLDEVLLKHIINWNKSFVLFIGDLNQLPPVKGTCEVGQFKTFRLEEVFRQNNGSLILENSLRVLEDKREKFGSDFVYDDEPDYSVFAPDVYNPAKARILAYHNATVEKHNKNILDTYYGGKMIPKTWVCFTQSYFVDDEVLAANNQKGLILSAGEVKTINVVLPPFVGKETYFNPNTYSIDVEVIEVEIDVRGGSVLDLYMPTELGKIQIADKLSYLIKVAKDVNNYDPTRWLLYFAMRDYFPSLIPAFASTVHKAQGATIQTVFIDEADINMARGRDLKKALRYTAYTRAKEQVIIIS